MNGTRQKVLNACVMAVRPYTMRELPGWGRLYELLVGGYRRNQRWTGFAPRWVRGKLHGYDMLIDLASWSNRDTYFLGRFYDVPNQLLIKALVQPGETVVDIGANEGMISLVAARQGHLLRAQSRAARQAGCGAGPQWHHVGRRASQGSVRRTGDAHPVGADLQHR